MKPLTFRPLLMAVLMGIAAALPGPAYAACSDVGAAIQTLGAEQRALVAEIRALEQLLQRIQVALSEEREDSGLVQEVRRLFGDQPGYELRQLQKLVSEQLANRVSRLKVVNSQLKSAINELQDCMEQPLDEEGFDLLRERSVREELDLIKRIERLLRAREGQSTSVRRPAPFSPESTITQSRGETEFSYTPPPGAGFGDGGP